jgi:glycosyltransferase involved in cell wall biosynthesis
VIAPRRGGRIRVLYVIGSLNVGGSERHILHLVNGLDRARFEPMICCLYQTGPLYPVAQAHGVPCCCLHMRRRGNSLLTVWHLARGAARLVRLMRQEQVTIVDAYLFLSYTLAIPCAWLAGVPVRIAQPRNLRTVKPPLVGRRLLERLVNRLVTRVVANAQAVAQDTMEDEGVPVHRMAVIYNGVAIPEESPGEGVRPPGWPAAKRIILCVANLRHGKGHHDLLAAATQVLPRFPDVALVLVGEGALRAALEARVAHAGLRDRVHFLGQREDVPALLAAAKLFVLPSHEEGFPNALLEAMAHGLPVVATRVGGVPEAVVHGETGLLVPPQDPAALAEALGALLRDPDLAQKMGRAGRERAASQFTLDRMVRETEALYAELLARTGQRRAAA